MLARLPREGPALDPASPLAWGADSPTPDWPSTQRAGRWGGPHPSDGLGLQRGSSCTRPGGHSSLGTRRPVGAPFPQASSRGGLEESETHGRASPASLCPCVQPAGSSPAEWRGGTRVCQAFLPLPPPGTACISAYTTPPALPPPAPRGPCFCQGKMCPWRGGTSCRSLSSRTGPGSRGQREDPGQPQQATLPPSSARLLRSGQEAAPRLPLTSTTPSP